MPHITSDRQPFEVIFQHLTGNTPLPWQRVLYERFVSDRAENIPDLCNMPTGHGIPSIVAIWLIAIAHCSDRIPHRLVYVVNRQTVVDQASIEVVNLREQLADNPALADLRTRLTALCSKPLRDEELPLSISTLRGQYADNAEWRQDATRPAVIVGTVDMIASRLLFSGDGVGFCCRQTFGRLVQDVLLVHEARLEPAFQGLLSSIEGEQWKCGDIRRLRVMELSATPHEDETTASECLANRHPKRDGANEQAFQGATRQHGFANDKWGRSDCCGNSRNPAIPKVKNVTSTGRTAFGGANSTLLEVK